MLTVCEPPSTGVDTVVDEHNGRLRPLAAPIPPPVGSSCK
jgi:hypothetical protein